MKDKLQFKSKKQSPKGIAALILAVVEIIATVALLVSSSGSGGEIGIMAGIIAMGLIVCSLVGFLLALKSLYERDIQPVIPILALTLNGLIVIFYLCIYILGF